jgi:hypothetical protein
MYPLVNCMLLNNCRVFSGCAVVSPSRRARVGRLLPAAFPPATVLPALNFRTQLLPSLRYHHHHHCSCYCRSSRCSRTKATQLPAPPSSCRSTTASGGLASRRLGTEPRTITVTVQEPKKGGGAPLPPLCD